MTEPLWRRGTRVERRFSERAGVHCRRCSLPLQRILTDFGADLSFGRVPEKLLEHYGIEMPTSTVLRVTEHHARCCHEWADLTPVKAPASAAGVFIGEMDGSMVPVVETVPEALDKRRAKAVSWKEARLCLVHLVGSATPVFGGHFAGGVAESGRQWADCARRAGFGTGSRMHAVGDGAPWIAEQMESQFGANARYLVDFYHLCEYLSSAAQVCAPEAPGIWLDRQKERLKTKQAKDVLKALEPFIEADPDAPAAACHRYLRNRLHQVDYQGALELGLPIGSGEIESAHRYIIQERLKRAGAWWAPSHVDAMLALRLNRANRQWNAYWGAVEKEAA